MLRTTPAPGALVLGCAAPTTASRRRPRRCARLLPPAAGLSDPATSGVDGGGDLDVGLFVRKAGGGASAAAAAPAPSSPPPPSRPPTPPPPSAALPQELVDAGVTAIHTNLPIPGATRAGPGKVATTPAGRYAHSAMAEGGAGFWHRATNNAANAPRMFWDRLGDGFAWRNKPSRASGDGGKPGFAPKAAAAGRPGGKAAGKKGFGGGAVAATDPAPASPALLPSAAPSWFPGGTTSLAWNAVDRHVEAGQGDRVALVGCGAGAGAGGSLTFAECGAAAAALAAWLRGPAGLAPGEAVAILLPPGLTSGVAALAASRAGCGVLVLDPAGTDATADALATARPRVLVTASPWKAAANAAVEAAAGSTASSSSPSSPSYAPDTVLVYEQGDATVAATPWCCGRDVWAHAALEEGGGSATASAAAPPPACWVASDAPGVLLPSSSSSPPLAIFIHPAAGYCVGAGAAARLAWDVRAGDAVAAAAPPGSPAGALAFWGALLNCAASVAMPPLQTAGTGAAVAGSATAWARAAAAARVTHIVAGSSASAAALAAADPVALAEAAAAGLRLVTVAAPDPDPAAIAALAAALPPATALTAAWLPDGAGTPPLAGIPGPAAPSTPAGLRPFLRSAGDWTTAWPAVAARSLPQEAWVERLLAADGSFAQPGAAWVAVEGGEDGEVVWSATS